MKNGNMRGTGGNGSGRGNTAPETDTYSDADIANLLFMLEEEKLAGDIYAAFYDQTGLRIFDNIAASEDRHHDALLNQASSLGVDVIEFVSLPAGSYVNPALQAMYDDLLAMGSDSATAALNVGVLIEETDIVDLQDAVASVEGTALADVYGRLLDGSENHLEAFESALGL